MRLFALIFMLFAPHMALACGAETDCEIPSGTYRIAKPDGQVQGTILFFHGWQGTAARFMRSKGLMRQAAQKGLVVVAPQGLGKSWSFPGSPSQSRDEMAFVDALLADLETRHGLDPDRMLVTGFSLGGSMVWNIACYRGDKFAGYAPIAGAFWDPIPQKCPSPMPILLHVHGKNDQTVPLAGRAIANSRQGDVFESLTRWRIQGQCNDNTPTNSTDGRALSCQRWSNCGGGVIEICLHEGKHAIRTEWVMRAWDELVAIKGW